MHTQYNFKNGNFMTIVSILYVILAIFGLSFLIFIHELGHYYMARRCGMRVETFSVGIGKPLCSWMRNGVRWQIGWLFFGGYVKIAGMDGDPNQNPYDVKDGFYGKGPWDRIKVAFAGPIVNIVFAFLFFFVLWAIGGREKNFSDYTAKIGWVDPKSELYAEGVRPGDEILAYGGVPFQGAKDHIMAPMTSSGVIEVKGQSVDLHTKDKTPFVHTVKTYPHPDALQADVVTTGVLQPARYVIYDPTAQEKETGILQGAPMYGSGIQYGDRIVWVDGVVIYSLQQLSHILNDGKTLLTIQRGEDVFLRRVSRVHVEEMRLDAEVKAELIDWQFEAGLKASKVQKLYMVPYNLNNECLVEGRLLFIDKEKEGEVFSKHPFSSLEAPLEEGDRILAVDGSSVFYSYELFSRLQMHQTNIIVERDPKIQLVVPSSQADTVFDQQFQWDDLHRLVGQIGTPVSPILKTSGNLVLLHPITPKTMKEIEGENKQLLQEQQEEEERTIHAVQDPEKRAQLRQYLEQRGKMYVLGLPSVRDEQVHYNPGPFTLFGNVFEEIWHTLRALVTGSLNPKWMSGPVGIIQVVHDRSMVSLKDTLFWMGAISLNLGLLNLLPIPVLDGGTIVLSFYELITGKKLQTKTLEKLIIPFAVLLIGFFVYLTYHDLIRLFS